MKANHKNLVCCQSYWARRFVTLGGSEERQSRCKAVLCKGGPGVINNTNAHFSHGSSRFGPARRQEGPRDVQNGAAETAEGEGRRGGAGLCEGLWGCARCAGLCDAVQGVQDCAGLLPSAGQSLGLPVVGEGCEEGCIAATRGVLCILRTAALSRQAAALTGHVHPASLLPQLVLWAPCSGATHGTAGVDLGRKAVLGGALQSLVGSCDPFWGPMSSFGRGVPLDIPAALSAVK